MRRALLAALVLLACSTSAGVTLTPAPQAKKRKPATHTVTIDATRFSPEMLTIKAGDTVIWMNKDLIPHTASSQTESGGFDSGTILAGESWRRTFKNKGEVPYTCLFHPTMKATLLIQ